MVKVVLSGKDGDVDLDLTLVELDRAREMALGMGDEMSKLFERKVASYDTGLCAVMLLAQEMVLARSKADQVLFQGEHL